MRTNQRLAQLWLDALATELGASAGTIDTYTDDLSCYLVLLDENSLGMDDVSLEQICDYIAALDQPGYSAAPQFPVAGSTRPRAARRPLKSFALQFSGRGSLLLNHA
ncbi:site-specific integrase [Microvirga sp. 0TCS3.31]